VELISERAWHSGTNASLPVPQISWSNSRIAVHNNSGSRSA
jgi:hypothetical protein